MGFQSHLGSISTHEIWPKKAKFRRLLCRRPPVSVKGAGNDGTAFEKGPRPTASAFRETLIEREIVDAASKLRPRPTSFLQSREGERTTCGFHPKVCSQMMPNLQLRRHERTLKETYPPPTSNLPLSLVGPREARYPLSQPKWVPDDPIRLTSSCQQSRPHGSLNASPAAAKMLQSGAPAAALFLIGMGEQQCVTNPQPCRPAFPLTIGGAHPTVIPMFQPASVARDLPLFGKCALSSLTRYSPSLP